ncbi:hypothetical protein [Phocoenobacter skyensis]|uniref:Uncharacterized protein n=1 Tax=Phocoenobacter skyensis TaxID=97481 RepID=A0AAJ6NDQ9_9PAST|nr:hypothetical protein [Pasteurella skyensis]MDP8174865.1 hypothetical protein [Pasteurella skyensis]
MKKTQIILLLALFATIGNSVQAKVTRLTDETIDGVRIVSFTNNNNIPKEEYNKKKAHSEAKFLAKTNLIDISRLYEIDNTKMGGGYSGNIMKVKDRKFVFLYAKTDFYLKNGEGFITFYRSAFIGQTLKNTNDYSVVCASYEEMNPLTGACFKKVEEVFDIKRKDMVME